MLPLLYKEWLVLRTSWLVSVTGLFAILFLSSRQSLLPAAVILALTLLMSSTYVDDKNTGHLFLNSLPTTRKTIVYGKYIASILHGTSLIIAADLIQWGFSRFTGPLWDVNAAGAIFAFVWIAALYFPLYYWLGQRFVQYGLVIALIAFITLGPFVYHWGERHRWWGLVDALAPLMKMLGSVLGTPLGFSALIAVPTAFIVRISATLSLRLYERKTF
ncbi:MAG: ABC-2 transporter permease [Hydrogenibacillus sp.]|nr:ABC-2 transporter permease [Hydrogenibacillus sp.]